MLLPILLISCAATAPQSPAQADTVRTLDTGSVVVQTWNAAGPGSPEWFRISHDGGATYTRDRLLETAILLRYQEFDPLRDGAPSVPDALAAPQDNRLWIVQYTAPGAEAWRETLRTAGARDHRFLAWNANVWEMDAALAATVAELPFVRWVGPFHPIYKLEDAVRESLLDGTLAPRRYHVEVCAWGAEHKDEIVPFIGDLGGTVLKAIPEGWIVEAYLTPEQAVAVAAHPHVMGLDRKGDPSPDMNNARALMGSNYIEGLAGWTGQGLRAEVMDGGIDSNHADWPTTRAPVLHGTVSGDAHGTCTFGINFSGGASAGGAATRGILPLAQGVMADYDNLNNRYTHTSQCVNATYRCVYQSNSWGDPWTTTYTSVSQEMDDIIFLNDFSILQSQSNNGTQSSRPQAWAKNVIAVGALYHNNDQLDSNDSWSGGASIGPAADGRIKPDIACWYDQVWTSDEDPGGYVGGDDYTAFSGTSSATPIVAGHLGLIYQMWHEEAFGNVATGSEVFYSRPHNTLAKAMLLNSTAQWSFSGTTHDRTRTHQGWGRPDLDTLYDQRAELLYVNEESVLGEGGAANWSVTVPAGKPEFRATLVYADRAGTTSSSMHRINDLSLRVTDPNGTIYWGNNGLGAANASTSGGVSNVKDTVEQVILVNPVAGTWIVDVFADEVNQDSHTETPALDADFALVVRPVSGSSGGDPINTIVLTGVTDPIAGTLPYIYTFTGAPASSPAWLVASPNTSGTNYQGHDFDVGAPVTVASSGTSTATGAGSFTLVFPAALSGSTYFLEVACLGISGWRDSNALQVDIQ